ncbi:MAG: hypothetical protein QM817_04990 [Archangium sp.]
MKRVALIFSCFVASAAWADIPPDDPGTLPNTACVGQPEGSACGAGGRCVKQRVRRPDFSKPGAPTWVWTDVSVCVEPAKFAAVLVLLLLVIPLARKRAR